MKARVAKKFKFDGAHFLPHYDGICKNMHGHTWYVEIEVLGEVNTTGAFTGMVMDFHDFKALVAPELKLFDHTELNKTLDNPTAENLAAFFYRRLREPIENQVGLTLLGVTVWESPDSWAKVLASDQVLEEVEDSYPQVLAEDGPY